MNEFEDTYLEHEQGHQRSAILRVYNYYRILIAFVFLFLFLDPNFSAFVGNVNPELFQTTIIFYIGINILIGLATLFINVRTIANTTISLTVLIADIIGLTLLMSASGGVSSGLGNFLIFTLAFGGGLIHGRVSTVLPAIAFILTIYTEVYLFFLDQSELQSFFQAGLLGIVYFVTNILFQTLSRQLRVRETEVHKLEQINQLVIEKMRTGVVVIDSENQARLMNQSAEKFLYDSSAANLSEEGLPHVLVEKLNQWKEDPDHKAIQFSLGNSSREILANFSELHTPSTEADTLVFLEDSTEVQRQAQQLKLAGLGRLSASIAHEIRNPLGAISHAAQLLVESRNLDKGDQRLCEIIQTHSVRMNGVIENVLQMSRRKMAEPKKIELDEWLPAFVEEFNAAWSVPADITVVMEPKGINIVADPLHLTQILGNLCQNGLRYSKKKTGVARLKILGGHDASTNRPFLEVIDFGNGVEDKLVSNLFEPFYTTETTGTGLGLYLSKELCEANDARLNYSRADTGGGSFRITFLDY